MEKVVKDVIQITLRQNFFLGPRNIGSVLVDMLIMAVHHIIKLIKVLSGKLLSIMSGKGTLKKAGKIWFSS